MRDSPQTLQTSGHTQHRANGEAPWQRRVSCIVQGKVLVTGASGYFGFKLSSALAAQGMSVVLLDLQVPPWDIPTGACFHQGDIRDYRCLLRACVGVDCVFHTASYGMSGSEQLRKEEVELINVGGTKNILNMCLEQCVPRLVYTSTVNVVFAGRNIEDGDEETVPPVPLQHHIDHYSRTKAIAERMILAANGRPLRTGDLLQTCVLRPSGIYGPGERRHLHRVMGNVERRLFSFSFGKRDAKMNWVHVENLVMAHVLAAEGLKPSKGCVASGQAYFINDGEAVNVFQWLTPLFHRLGYSKPRIHLPVFLVYCAAAFMEYVHVALRPVVDLPLLFTRNEVRNIAVSHTFKIEKARRDLGYSPRKYDLMDCVELCLWDRAKEGRGQRADVHWAVLLVLLLGLASLWIFCSGHGCDSMLVPNNHTRL